MSAPLTHLARTGRLDRFLIGGEWVAPLGTGSCMVVNPATETEICHVPMGNARDVDAAVTAARDAFEGWSAHTPEDRAARLDRLADLMEDRAELLAACLTEEMGAAIASARALQVPLAVAHLRTACEVLRNFEFTSPRGTTAITHEPIGVCALITPWNWPLYQITAKLGPALAAGCTIVLKPSELAPLSAILFAELVEEAGFPAGVFNLVQGDGPGVGTALATHEGVDMISVTGSTRAGVAVAKAAADTVKRVAQELGGKSPNVILPDADLDRAVSMGVASGMRNLGQSCSAPTRMIVPRAVLQEVEAIAARAVSDIVVGDPTDPAATHGAIANRAQYERVIAIIEAGLSEGARIVAGGPGRPEGLTRGYFVRPTIFSEVRTDMRIAQEEIFGPVLCIIPYDDEEEAVRIANDTVYGLGAHVQGRDMDRVRAVARRIRAGQVLLNNPGWDPHAPFGGYKRSGNGREFGREGLLDYLEVKAILGHFPVD
ncbi:aldehyde dehydrogenase family protein [Palleronia sp. LCG004]|uniref:aldehyde dehydrogenase family protein n=1 Tax=Palleronia sp. LCG004 TaxID=3079304 RepID=UPI0029437864|nr:aldehyde dehydrogenase family protein [Palleronia sp. LCG004]WOI58099.1 aldehyde dehydrogenase family protein [Palleronia sp. LCG004]